MYIVHLALANIVCEANISSRKVIYRVGTSDNISSAIAHIDKNGGSAGVLAPLFSRSGVLVKPPALRGRFCVCKGGQTPPLRNRNFILHLPWHTVCRREQAPALQDLILHFEF